ncbi:Uma2 family endonuclease [Streptomyces bluensis]|uniref:Uma2 family endonuclease n=1 Tax=Streptomyces bluensis TaxID=33897 RepID=A0ABW6UDK3_9ACTN
MTALMHESPESAWSISQLDEVVWEVWKAIELPEGYRAEIIEGAIEVSPIGRLAHARVVNRLRAALLRFLGEGQYASYQGMNVIHQRRGWIPDVIVAPEDLESHADEDGLGVDAAAAHVVFEVVSPGKRNQERDRVRKLREYARAGIPVYVIIDDYHAGGTVTVLTEPRTEDADWVGLHRVPYGTEVIIPEGPAKGFAITEAITGPARAEK